MIFVTVGTHYQGFERLIKKMDDISGHLDEDVIAQIGSTKYKPKNMTYFTFGGYENEIIKLCKNARIIVSHAGAGSILTVFYYMKPIIIIPRLEKFNEHVDDHQLELAKVLENNKNFLVVYDVKKLETILNEARKPYYSTNNKKDDRLINFLKKKIETK
jgi:UDP-N-acetylglucosamine transferase subunit ALG13